MKPKMVIHTLMYLILCSVLPLELYAQRSVPIDQQASPPQTQSAPQSPPPTGVDAPASSSQSTDNSVANMRDNLQKAEAQIILLRDKVETITGMMTMLIGVLAVLLTLGGLTSLWSWFQNERRATQAHALAIRGETAAQDRTHEVHTKFLEGSVQTLDLVNSTLQLAKDASERAAKSVQQKAQSTLARLDQDARQLVASVPEQDERRIVADLDTRTRLKTLAHKIMGFEINQLLLPEELALTPHCIFIRGMYQHLEQQFMDAIESWTAIALSSNAPDDLKSLAWYWIGYENNNIGAFANAEHSFAKALETASTARSYELRRILIESRFFHKKKEPAQKLIQPLQELLEKVDQDKSLTESKQKTQILVTLGNICRQAAIECSQEATPQEIQELRDKAISAYRAAGDDKWAMFGLAEMLYDSGSKEDAAPLFLMVKDLAHAEATNRDEMRTKVLARTTELICCMCVTELQKYVAQVYGHASAALGQVDGRLTVYSQMEKRNIPKEEFRVALDKLVAEYKTAGVLFDA